MDTRPYRPALRYHGGKWKLAPWIISHFPPHRIYIEPFGGAASVLLRKPRSYAEVYNDLWDEVVNLFRVLRSPEQAARLVDLVRLTPFARSEFEESYQPDDCPIEQARRTVVRSFMGFGSNGLNQPTGFRNNANRSGSTPAHDWGNYPPVLAAIAERMAGVVVESRPAVDVILASGFNRPDALVYADPPYMMKTRGDTDADYAHEMTDEQHIELSNALHTCESMVVLSGYRCDLYDEMYADWQRVDRVAHADGARKRTESLWIKPNTITAPTLFDTPPANRRGGY